MANTLKLWISAETGRLLSNPSSFTSAQPQVFYSGNNVDLELHLLEGAGVARSPFEVPFPAGSTIQVAVGTVATAPTSGQWRLSVSSTETADLAYNASASAVQTALNALSAVSTAGGVTVAALGGGYSITWNTVGTKPAILSGSDTLAPASYEAILVLQAGDVSTREIVFVELRQSPVALSDSFSAIGTPVVSSSVVSAWNGTNKVVRVSISPTPKSGSFTLDVDGNTAVIQAFSGSTDVRVAMQDAGITSLQDVTVTGQNQYDIVFTADVTVSVNGSGLIASPGVVGSLNLATSELIAYLGAEATKDASFEVSVTASGATQTLVQVPCVVANGVVASGAVSPVPVGTLLTEAVANNRFVRRDAAQSPSSADLDIIWPNLGVTTDGSDTAAAISNASAPAGGNPFLTLSAGNAAYSPLFDQTLNKVDDVQFGSVTVKSPIGIATIMISAGSGITFEDTTQQSTAFIPADYLSKAGNLSGLASVSTARTNLGLGTMAVETASNYLTTASASSTYLTISSASSTYLTISTASSTYALLTSFDQGVKTTDSPSFSGLTLTAGSVTFADSTTQDTRVVREQQANGSGFSTGGFDTTHYPYEVKVIDDTGTAYWVPARL